MVPLKAPAWSHWKPVRKRQEHKKRAGLQGTLPDRKNSSTRAGMVPSLELDKEGKVIKKHKTKHKHKAREGLLCQRELKLKSFTYSSTRTRSRGRTRPSSWTTCPPENKLKGLKHERDHCKKEEKLSKMKSEEKTGSLRTR